MTMNSYIKGLPYKVSDHFYSTEFDCPCDNCRNTLIDAALPPTLEALRVRLNTKITIISGFRCASYQQQLRLRGYDTAIGLSQHEMGKAVDLTNGVAPGIELADFAKEAGFKAIGVGKNWIHVDLRNDKERLWTYKY